MAARALNKSDEISSKLLKRSLSYRNNYNPSLESDGFKSFVARRFPNGTFPPSNPVDCSPLDTNSSRPCSLQSTNIYGGHESSSWEYSFYAPHDGAGLVSLLGGPDTFTKGGSAASVDRSGNQPAYKTLHSFRGSKGRKRAQTAPATTQPSLVQQAAQPNLQPGPADIPAQQAAQPILQPGPAYSPAQQATQVQLFNFNFYGQG